MSKPAARKPTVTVSGYETSLVRCAVALLLVLVGIAWIAVYTNVAMDAANYVKLPGVKKPHTPFPWMSDLHKWNYLIGFGLAFIGLPPTRRRRSVAGAGWSWACSAASSSAWSGSSCTTSSARTTPCTSR